METNYTYQNVTTPVTGIPMPPPTGIASMPTSIADSALVAGQVQQSEIQEVMSLDTGDGAEANRAEEIGTGANESIAIGAEITEQPAEAVHLSAGDRATPDSTVDSDALVTEQPVGANDEIRRIAEDQFPLGIPRLVHNLDAFERVADEYFTQVREPLFIVNRTKVYPNAACVRLLEDVEYVTFLINKEQRLMALKPCDRLESGAYRWRKIKDGKIMSAPRNGKAFVYMLCAAMDWNPEDRYQIRGALTRDQYDEPIISFDMLFYKHFSKGNGSGRDKYISDWNGRFGPTYAECKRSMRINTYEGFTVLTEDGEASNAQPKT